MHAMTAFDSSETAFDSSEDSAVCYDAAISAEGLSAAATEEEEEPKLDVTHTSEMPVSEAVKIIGGTHAGSAPVCEAPTAGKALDSVPVGPDPAAAAPAADDTPQDGDYFLDATLADSKQVHANPKRTRSAESLYALACPLS